MRDRNYSNNNESLNINIANKKGSGLKDFRKSFELYFKCENGHDVTLVKEFSNRDEGIISAKQRLTKAMCDLCGDVVPIKFEGISKAFKA